MASRQDLTVDQAAELFGVHPNTVREWTRDGMPVLTAGGKGPGRGARIDAPAAVAWYVARRQVRAPGRNERARLDKEAADRLALQNAATRRDLARLGVIQREVDAVVAFHQKDSLAVVQKIAPQLVGLGAEQIRVQLEVAIHELLRRLADYQPGVR